MAPAAPFQADHAEGALFEHATAGVCLVAPDGTYLSVNRAMCEMLGYERHELEGVRTFGDITHPDDRTLGVAFVDQALAGTAGRLRIAKRYVRKDGRTIWVDVSTTLVERPGAERCFLTHVQDITERTLAEQSLAASEAQLRQFIKHTPAAVAMFDNQMRYLQVSDRWLTDQRVQEQDIIGRLHYEVFPEIPERWREIHRRVLAGAVERCDEDTFVRGDGTIEFLQWEVRPWRTSADSIGGLMMFTQDITDRKRALERIQHLNRVYAVLTEINQAIMRETDPQALMEAACGVAVETGRFRMACIGVPDESGRLLRPVAAAGVVDGFLDGLVIDLTRPIEALGPTGRCYLTGRHAVCNDIEEDPAFAHVREPALTRGYRSSGAFPLKVDGQLIGVINLYSGEPAFFDAGELTLLDELAADLGFGLEIQHREAERRRAEQALRASEDQFASAFEFAPIGKALVALDGRWLKVNHALCQMLGYTADELYGRTFQDITHPGDLETDLAYIRRLIAGEIDTYQMEKRYVHKDGRHVSSLLTVSLVRSSSGDPAHFISQIQDMTERRQLEDQFRQSQKLEAIGQLAGGVAHDFNNILTAIGMQAERLGESPDLPAALRRGLHQIRAYADRAANLTQQLLLFSRKQVLQPRQLDLNDVVANLTRMLKRIIGEEYHLDIRLADHPLIARADPGMLDQLLMNLVINARDAMPGGGTLVIETFEKTLSEEAAARIPDATPGRHVGLRVTDTGCGIAADVLPRIFEPFFTTKEPGKGTGLGLATVFGIVKQHGGTVVVDSEPERGATFEICLPSIGGTASAPHAPPADRDVAGGSETILLVEDQPDVRELTQATLESAGYTVIEAASGVEAIAIWRQHRDRIQLLLTDVVMPGGIRGSDLAARLRADRRDLRVVFVSGYSPETTAGDLALDARQAFLPKPFSRRALLDLVRRTLEA